MTTRKPRGRPKSADPRTEMIRVLFTPEEKRLIQRMAGRTGMSLWIYQHITPILEGAKAKEEPTE